MATAAAGEIVAGGGGGGDWVFMSGFGVGEVEMDKDFTERDAPERL